MIVAAIRSRPLWILLLSLSLLTLLGAFAPLNDWLEYRQASWLNGQLWRPLTAWMAQLNLVHWLVNQWGLILLALVMPPRPTRTDIGVFVWVWLFASVMLLFSAYWQYAGLSGLLYGWLVWAVMRSPYYAPWLRWLVTLALTAKVAQENLFGEQGSAWVGQWISANIAVESHAWGLIAGWIALAVVWLWHRLQRSGWSG
ncbi:rhombosortase [Saccharospirillum sp. MSK14-1]|uniref:rhombosortase n=1 Tax=Saccharospirillum sp. MSK14-1 TaxID=1897632 RepID=UPI000D33B11C|nr:rhombosortase [Saccharospirillum sp. MSK14-1]PTY36425.1 rhombosortase [Saccharospirillum sp. MSK14-1]